MRCYLPSRTSVQSTTVPVVPNAGGDVFRCDFGPSLAYILFDLHFYAGLRVDDEQHVRSSPHQVLL